MTKKTAINIVIAAIVLAILLLVFFLFFKKDNNNNQPTENTDTNVISNFFPNSDESEETTNPENNTVENNNRPFQPIPKLRQISQNPTSGFILENIVSTSTTLATEDKDPEILTETKTLYTYVNRSNGNVLQSNSKDLNVERITNKTIPKVYEASFLDSKNVVFRYIDDNNKIQTVLIKTFYPEEENASSTEIVGDGFAEVKANYLPENIWNIEKTTDNLIFYTTGDSYDNLFGYVVDPKKPVLWNKIFESEIKYLNFSWVDKDTLVFGTKPALFGDNFLFEYDTSKKTTRKLLSAKEGFTFLVNKNFSYVFYSELDGQKIKSKLLNIKDGGIKTLDIGTIVGDKCVWSKKDSNIVYCAVPKTTLDSNYPIVWYKGDISLVDELYKINIETGEKTKVDGLDGEFDIIDPQISDDDKYFVFINKKDLSLWSLDTSR